MLHIYFFLDKQMNITYTENFSVRDNHRAIKKYLLREHRQKFLLFVFVNIKLDLRF